MANIHKFDSKLLSASYYLESITKSDLSVVEREAKAETGGNGRQGTDASGSQALQERDADAERGGRFCEGEEFGGGDPLARTY